MNPKLGIIALFVGQAAFADPLFIPQAGGSLFGQVVKPAATQSPLPVVPLSSPMAMPGPIQPVSQVPPTTPMPLTPASTMSLPTKPVMIFSKPVQHKPVKKVKKINPEDDVVAPFYDITPDHKAIFPKSTKPAPKPVRPLEVPLPGLGSVQGDRLLNKSAVIRINGDGTEVVEVSNQFQNRISTPFDSPKIVDSSNSEFKIVGSNIYISLIGKPVVIYITGAVNGDPVISLTLIPKPIPAQTIVLQLDEPLIHHSSKQKDKPETYEQHLTSLLKTVASGDDPEGFTKGHIDNITARKGVLAVIPVARFSNAYMDIFSYKITNTGTADTRLSESSFYQKGVLAVGMFPASTLRHNETTFVYVISNKSALGGEAHAQQ